MTELGSIHDLRDNDLRNQASTIISQALLIGELSDENRDLRLERDMLIEAINMLIEAIRQQAEWLRDEDFDSQAVLLEMEAGIYQEKQS